MRISGIGIGRGIAAGSVLRMPAPIAEPRDVPATADPDIEHARVAVALRETAAELQRRAERVDGEAREILEAQALMAEDPSVVTDIHELIDAGKTAERAVWEAFRAFQEILQAMGGYLAARAADLRDVCLRAVAQLRGEAMPGVPESETPFVLVAHDLAPADTALLDLSKVLAIVTSAGSPTSHTAILARSRELVAVVGAAGSDALVAGQTVVVDAAAGEIVTDPTSAELREAAARGGRVARAHPVTPGRLADGTPLPLLANVAEPAEAAAAVALGAEGVGLFRTEFLYLDAQAAPSVELQTRRYRELLAAFPGKKVVVRVLDAGADKQLAFLGHEYEENPALGRRGLRALREHEEVLRDQLTALVAAAEGTGAELQVMAPMVADLDETRYFVELARSLGVRTVGITAEVPSSAILAEQLAPLCDFISIGTNDLTQYTLAADRMLGSVAAYQSPWHPAVLRLVRLIGDAGAAAGIPVGVCGEAAGDPLLAVVLVGLGCTNLSMAPTALAEVREELARHSLAGARELARLATSATSAREARALVAASASAVAASLRV